MPAMPPEAAADSYCGSRSTTFSVKGLRISAICASGDDRPVIFLHGNSSTKTVWRDQIDLVCRFGRAVLAPDLPGHGESENSKSPESTYSFPGYAAVIGGLLDALGWESVDIVGWSLGGHIGLELLATEPRIHSLLIVGTPPVRLGETALDAFFADEDMCLAGKAEFSEKDALAYGTAMMGGQEMLTPELLAAIRRTDGNARKFMFSNALKSVGSDERWLIAHSPKSVCVVHGEREPFVRLDYLLTLNFRALWRDRIFVISGAGHAPHWQCPELFNEILLDFLGLVPARPMDRIRPLSPLQIST